MSWKQKIRFSIQQTIFRDLELNRRAIGYLVLVMTDIIFNVVLLVNKVYVGPQPDGVKALTIASVVLGVVSSGIIADGSRDKIHLTFVAVLSSACGLALMAFESFHLQTIGIMITGFTTTLTFCTWISVIIHETTPLNRGRLLALVLVLGAMIALIVLFFTADRAVERWAFVPNLIIAILLYIYSFEYFVFDSKESLQTTYKFREVSVNKNIIGYSLAIGFLAFSLGVLFPIFEADEMLVSYLIAILVVTILGGILIDNTGRKFTFVAGSTVFLGLLIFLGAEEPVAFSLIYGAMSAVLFILVVSVSGDLTIEKARAFRSRIVSVFFLALILGFAIGYSIGEYSTGRDEFVDLPYKLGMFFISLEVATVVPLQESLTRKDTEWYRHLKQMFVFHTTSGICLFDYDFTKYSPQETAGFPSKDLISGGLTGIVALISEITQSQTQLQVVDHGDSKILFNYGKYTTIALIAGRYLRTFVAKLRAFGKEFEDIFEDLLADFRGDVTIFDSAEYLVERFFQQKYLGLKDQLR